MRRWNGWGEESIGYPLPEPAADYLAQLIGRGEKLADVTLEAAQANVPASRLSPHPLLSDDPHERLLHARGQSLPDWIALRSGQIGTFPDGVAYPETEQQVRSLLDYGRQSGTHLIPYGGGTSVVGHINPQADSRRVVSVDMRRMAGLLHIDHTSRLATFGAGVTGPDLENHLRPHGYTLGHYPQSFEYSTLGGWIVTRSSGQQSYYYGRVEEFFAGGRLETPIGPAELPLLPASAAGPDIRQLVLGSEGRLGILTRATVRVRPLPEHEGFYACFFRDWQSGVKAVRSIVQARLPVSMVRLSDAQETETTLALSGMDSLLPWADRGLRAFGFGAERCLMLYGHTGRRNQAGPLRRQVSAIARANTGLPVGGFIGKQWRKSRFRSPYLRNTLWERGYAIDTLETAVPWSAVMATAGRVKAVLQGGLAEIGERVLVFCHLSHIYEDGASIYVTYLYRRAADPDETLRRWQRLKDAASKVIVAQGGTISHQHGVGRDHAPYLPAEKGAVGMCLLQAMGKAVDPDGMMNPGKLLGGEVMTGEQHKPEDQQSTRGR